MPYVNFAVELEINLLDTSQQSQSQGLEMSSAFTTELSCVWTGWTWYDCDDFYTSEPASLAWAQTSQRNITVNKLWFLEANVF